MVRRSNSVSIPLTRALLLLALMVSFPAALPAQKDVSEAPWVYDAVSIKLEDPNVGSVGIRRLPTGFEGYLVTLKDLVVAAYGLKDPSLVANAPDWKTHYHVIAKLDGDRVTLFNALPPEQQSQKSQQMLQALLAEYFHLKIHHYTKDLAVYSLIVDKHGLKVKPVVPGEAAAADRGAPSFVGDGVFIGLCSMAQLAHFLNVGRMMQKEPSDRLVVDDTGIKGDYQFNLAWDTASRSETQGDDQDGALYDSLGSALINEAGLRLVPKKIQADAIVVDHAEEPTLN